MKNLFTLPMEEGKVSSFEKYIIKNISLETEKEINEMNIKINEFQWVDISFPEFLELMSKLS